MRTRLVFFFFPFCLCFNFLHVSKQGQCDTAGTDLQTYNPRLDNSMARPYN